MGIVLGGVKKKKKKKGEEEKTMERAVFLLANRTVCCVQRAHGGFAQYERKSTVGFALPFVLDAVDVT